MRKYFALILLLTFASCKTYNTFDTVSNDKKNVNELLDAWHKAAADAQFNNYFDMLADDAIFIGTDPTENWNKKEFQEFAKPYFKRGKAWNFKSVARNVFFSADQNTAWFDELLDTQMKICRGSGVARKEGGQWKIVHYVLSMTIPNDNVDEVVKIKSASDDTVLEKLKK